MVSVAEARKLEARRKECAAVAGKSTLNRLELSRAEPTRYHKIAYDEAAIEPVESGDDEGVGDLPLGDELWDVDARDQPNGNVLAIILLEV